ncbi:MAG TPA: hypothetical protein GXX36_07625 [Clostridiaceae bacterium]|nr:hypothetical protein [Clostridiaceae bacterium]
MKLRIISALLITILVFALTFSSVFANEIVKLNNISDKAPGDSVTISGSTTFPEISIKVIAPDKTVLYISTSTGGDFTKEFTLSKDAVLGTYEVVAGVGSSIDTTTFKVISTAQPKIISIDEVHVTTKAKKAPVLPSKVTVRYDNDTSGQVAVKWDSITPAQYAQAGTFIIEGVVAGTSLKAKATVTVTASGGNTGGGNTGGGAIPILPSTPEDDQPKTDVPETDQPEGEIPESEKPADEVVYFSDLESVPWAKESIEALAAKGIVNGPGDGTFRPNNKVTRAEFLKMLLTAFDLVDKDAQGTFSDVKAGMWYYEAVASAEKLGIVKGKGDGSFGVNQHISRQDMAVMVYRTSLILGMNLSVDSGEVLFADKDDISAYALEAVAAMQKNGIIKGVGDNRFSPKSNATRAEAAVIIYRLYKIFNQ